MFEVKVPEVGESISEGEIVTWFKQDGDMVQVDDELFELETDKITATVAAEVAGKLSIKKGVDEVVAIHEIVATIDTSATGGDAPAASKASEAETAAPASAPASSGASGDVMSPAARHHAAQHGLTSGDIQGTGKDGRVMKDDVLRTVAAGASKPAPQPAAAPKKEAPTPSIPKIGKPADGPRQTRRSMTPIRKRIAERLVQAQQTAAILTTFNEVDLSAVIAIRKKYQDQFVKKYGIKLGFMSFFVKAAVDALQNVPGLNAYIDGTEIVQNHFYDIGIAVGTEKGLVVPVVRDAETLSFAGVEAEISNLAKKARNKKLTLQDLQGGSFTITNGGIYGSLISTPILNPPQSGILGMHGFKQRPVEVNGKVELRPMMYLALSYDHRIVDGKDAVTFLKRICDCVENPERMLLGI
ncbi:MAG: dihydrolipoyllysine-residue succinyltransferase [Deltaproteobacteria bacterium]|nr:dihydrolipoyllysine-residue succinyltransferase [Deltaproteobacteria bacterium]